MGDFMVRAIGVLEELFGILVLSGSEDAGSSQVIHPTLQRVARRLRNEPRWSGMDVEDRLGPELERFLRLSV